MDKTSTSKILKLGLMMFMQYMLMAVWWVPLAAYLVNLELSGIYRSLILSSMAIGSMASAIIGMVADRYFASEKVLAVSNIFTAVFLFIAAQQTNPNLLLFVMIFVMLCYMPTWGLTSSIAMAHIKTEQFPRIRVFGSIGWVAAGFFSLIAFSVFNVEIFDGSKIPFYCGSAIALLAALSNLFLPHTPPLAKGQKISILDALGLRAFTLLKDRNFLIFILLSFLSIIPFSLYHVFGSEFLQSQDFRFITFTMNLGQVVEIFFMIIATTIIVKVGIKWALFFGLIALLFRYVFFYFGNIIDQQWLYILGIIVHGIIFGLFYVGGQVYTEMKAPKELRAQAQGLLFFIIFGVGLFIGTILNGVLIDLFSTSIETEFAYKWDILFAITSIFTLIILVVFVVLFKDEKHINRKLVA